MDAAATADLIAVTAQDSKQPLQCDLLKQKSSPKAPYQRSTYHEDLHLQPLASLMKQLTGRNRESSQFPEKRVQARARESGSGGGADNFSIAYDLAARRRLRRFSSHPRQALAPMPPL
jgi:hypothetical protein